MTVAFKVTDEKPHVGRRAKAVPQYVTDAIATALSSGKNVESGALTEDEFKALRADFRRAERADGTVKCVVSRNEKGGKLHALVSVTKAAKK